MLIFLNAPFFFCHGLLLAMVRHKTLSFRPTDIEKQKLEKYMAAHAIDKETDAIRAMAFQQSRIVPSSLVDKPETRKGTTEKRFYTKLSLIPPNLPNVKREISKFLRGHKSDLVKTLLEITPDTLNRAFTCATPKGIITLIPSMHAIPSTTTHDTNNIRN